MEKTLQHPLHFRLVRRFGTATGLLSFTGVGAVAVDGQGHLAVVDDGECQIVVISVSTGLPGARLGKCGDGPGEFRKIRSLAYFDSHYVVLDAASRSVIWVTDDGTETRRLRLQLYKEDGVSFVTRVDQVDDTTLVANVELNPTLGQSGGSQALIAVVDAKSGKTRRRGVSDVTRSVQNPAPFARGAEACLAGTGDGARVAVLNRWAFEGLLLAPHTLRVKSHFRTVVPWTGARHVQQQAVTVDVPKAVPVSVACAPTAILTSETHSEYEGDRRIRAGAYLELRSLDGRLLGAATVPPTDTVALSRPAAGFGDYYFFRSNPRDGIPQVLQYAVSYEDVMASGSEE